MGHVRLGGGQAIRAAKICGFDNEHDCKAHYKGRDNISKYDIGVCTVTRRILIMPKQKYSDRSTEVTYYSLPK